MAKVLKSCVLILAFVNFFAHSGKTQKLPLDHTVYDEWETIDEKLISNDGTLVVYTIVRQEGDGVLVIQKSNGHKLLEIPRGYSAILSENGEFLISKIKPLWVEIKRSNSTASTQKPKDSLVIVYLKSLKSEKHSNISSLSYSNASNWLAWISVDSTHSSDSLKGQVDVQSTAVLKNLQTSENFSFPKVQGVLFDKLGKNALLKCEDDSSSKLFSVLVINSLNKSIDTILNHVEDVRSYVWSEDGGRLAFYAKKKLLEDKNTSFYHLYYYQSGWQKAQLLKMDTSIASSNYQVDEAADIRFSKTGNKLFFGVWPVLPPLDSTISDFDKVKVDIWHYADDDLQSVQQKNIDKDKKKGYTMMYNFDALHFTLLENHIFPKVLITANGDGAFFYTNTDSGRRIERQWQGYTVSDVYVIEASTGNKELVAKNFKGSITPSATGRNLLLYDEVKRKYFVYSAIQRSVKILGSNIKAQLYDEQNDWPDDPKPYGVVKWFENDSAVLINDRYDIWKLLVANGKGINLTRNGREKKWQYRFIDLDFSKQYISSKDTLIFKIFDENNKSSGLALLDLVSDTEPKLLLKGNTYINAVQRSNYNTVLLFTQETYFNSPDLYTLSLISPGQVRLSQINPQQKKYLWGSVELYSWQTFNNKKVEGLLFKPENFDPTKKYPMLVHYYERNSQNLNLYIPPTPSPGRLNISFFVSRGYVVFVPDIWYIIGHPGKSAYNHVVSGTRSLIKKGFIDSTRIGLQGQSWGGYQTSYIITQTNLFAAAWAGAPVANMFSGYGGIRWESGISRQLLYEKNQSRIGATIWQKPKLYYENSPLFHLQNVTTPLVIMANDADGAVLWYEGIQLFTALRRLNKKVWMLNYNSEEHNLTARKNKKDLQIRQQQFFDWLLKGINPPLWLEKGVPYNMKGRKGYGLNN